MKRSCLMVALAMPALASAVVTEPQTTLQSQETARPGASAPAKAHRPLFIVRYVLWRAAPEAIPRIVMDDARPQLAPPAAGGYRDVTLGALHRDPNVFICSGWGCERWP